MRAIALLAALALALSGCGPEPARQTIGRPAQTAAQLAPGANACGGAAPYLTAAACADPNVAALSASMSQVLANVGAALSRQGRLLLVDGQAQWLAAMRVTCGLAGEDRALSLAQSACVQIAMLDRTINLPGLVQPTGPHTIQQVESFRALPAPATARDRVALMSAAFHPRIDDPDEYEAAFNDAAIKTLRADLPDAAEQTIVYRIAFADRTLISVEYDTLFATRGAAHQDRDVEALTFLLAEKRPLRADDLFRANWQSGFLAQVEAKLKLAVMQDGCDAPLAKETARAASLRADRWLVSPEALIVLYPPYALGPYSLEGCRIALTWRDLAPLLRPDAPVPATPKKRPEAMLDG